MRTRTAKNWSTVLHLILLTCLAVVISLHLPVVELSASGLHSRVSTTASGCSRSCPPGCNCSTAKSVGGIDNPVTPVRCIVRCNRPRLFTSIEAIHGGTSGASFPADIVHLDLSGNAIVQLNNDSFASVASIEKLNLDNNRIEVIFDDAFAVLDHLKFLNLSDNNLRTLRNSSFAGLSKLEKLFLSGNHFMRLSESVFEPLIALKLLDLARNPLICDCKLHWIANWTATYRVQLSRRSTCLFPTPLQGLRIHKLNRNQWHCNWPLQIPAFELHPSASQVVFAGDPLNFTCRVSNVEASGRLHWLLDDTLIETNESSGELLDVGVSPSGDLIVGSIAVSSLTAAHQGTWSCVLETDRGNLSQSVSVRVVSTDTPHCAPSFSSGNKGRYEWPQALAGVTVEIPCGSPSPIPSPARKLAWASRVCDENGVWRSLDTSECPYVSEVTKVLEQFAKTDLSIARASVIENMQRLKNYTGDGTILRDKMDLVFITRTIYKYLEFVPKHREIGELLVDLVAIIMHLDGDLLAEAQLEDRSCSRLVEAMERLSELTSEGVLRRHRDNLAVEDFVVKVESFNGISCASYVRGGRSGLLRSSYRRTDSTVYRRLYRCKVGSRGLPPDDDMDEILETSMRLPASLFQHHALPPTSVGHKLQFTFYHDASLFPRPPVQSRQMDVVSSVVGSHLAKYLLVNLTDPVVITLRTPIVSGKIIPVWWDFDANGKHGDWSSDGCKLRGIYGNLVSFDCNRLANFGLLQDAHQLALLRARSIKGAKFRPCHPMIYVGGAIGVFCLAWAIVTYVIGFGIIHVAKKNKHALMNLWFSLIMICLTFTLAVRHTEEALICQGVGLVLHYLSLVVLFWFLIIASNILKKLTRLELLDLPVDDEPPPDRPPPPKPMLRFYLVGWGIPVIVCGISGAVNLVEYAGHDYCFLAVTHSVGTFYGPCGVIVLLICIYYLLIYCAICRTTDCEKTTEVGGADRNGTNMELVNIGCEVDDRESLGHRTGSVNASSSGGSDDMEDCVHSAPTQLRAQVFLLLVYLLSWASAAISTAEPFSGISASVTEVVFGSLFALLFSCLGVFVLLFHCAFRDDALDVWRLMYGCRKSSLACARRPVTEEPSLADNCAMDRCGGPRSEESLDSCFDDPSLHVPANTGRLSKFCNVTADVGATDTSWSGEMFYNPYQNGVARKFFRKHSKRNVHPQQQQQQQHRSKLNEDYVPSNNLGARRDDDNDGVGVGDGVVAYVPRPSVNLNLHTGPKKLMDKASRVMCRDRSVDSQLVSSSSQGIVSISPSHSGNCSDRSLLIVEEEEEEEDGEKCVLEGDDCGHRASGNIEVETSNKSTSPVCILSSESQEESTCVADSVVQKYCESESASKEDDDDDDDTGTSWARRSPSTKNHIDVDDDDDHSHHRRLAEVLQNKADVDVNVDTDVGQLDVTASDPLRERDSELTCLTMEPQIDDHDDVHIVPNGHKFKMETAV